MRTTQSAEVIVVGGGIVGLAMALLTSRAGIETVLLEKKPQQQYKAAADYRLRVSAISPASEYLFAYLGVWDRICAVRVSSYKAMRVWDAAGSALLHFDAADIQQARLGHIIENDLIQSVLLDAARNESCFHLVSPVEIQTINTGTRKVTVNMNGQADITARLLVGADGAQSLVRQSQDIEVDGWHYHQRALVCSVTTEKHHRYTAWQRFMPGGPVAFLPLENGACSIVWSVPDAEAQRLCKLDEQAFCSELTRASDACLGNVTGCGRRAVFPLRYQHAHSYVRERLALIGDAAHVVHPLAGQGVNMGLLDVVELGGLALDAVKHGRDPGAIKRLRRYERARRSENTVMGLAFDALNRLFGSEFKAVATARNLGLHAVDRSGWLKRFFMLRATGIDHALGMQYRRGNGSLLSPPEFNQSGV